MKTSIGRFFAFSLLIAAFTVVFGQFVAAQSRPQRPDPNVGGGKKNQRPTPKTEEELKKEEEERKRQEEEKNATPEEGVVNIETNVVNVDAVVYNKKTGQVINGLKKENFAVFEDGVKQTISNFAT